MGPSKPKLAIPKFNLEPRIFLSHVWARIAEFWSSKLGPRPSSYPSSKICTQFTRKTNATFYFPTHAPTKNTTQHNTHRQNPVDIWVIIARPMIQLTIWPHLYWLGVFLEKAFARKRFLCHTGRRKSTWPKPWYSKHLDHMHAQLLSAISIDHNYAY